MSTYSLNRSMESETPPTDYSDVPETKSLLPPLPDTILKPSLTLKERILDTDDTSSRIPQTSIFSTPPRRTTSRAVHTPSTPQTSSSATAFTTPKTQASPMFALDTATNPQTPKAKDPTSSPFSPVIPIDERFGVSLAEPDMDHTPNSPMEKLRYYETCQRTQDQEFEKTIESLKSSGWMSEAELAKLKKAKNENWRRWDVKIKSARKEVSLSKENSHSKFNFARALSYRQNSSSSVSSKEKVRS